MSGNFGLGWLFSSKKKAPRAKARRRDARPLRVEMLESKLPLAGNVTAVLAGDTLVLTGDAASNAIQISGINGLVRVIGQGTRINGQTLAQFNGVTNINILETGGNDAVTLSSLSLAGTVFARLDFATVGNDVFTAINVNLGGSLDLGTDPIDALFDVVSSAGADTVSLTNVTAGDDVYVVTGRIGAAVPGAARDSIVATRVTANNIDAINDFSQFVTGNGPDSVVLSSLNINSRLFIDASPDFGNSSAADVVSISLSTIDGDLDIRTDDNQNPGTSRGSDVATISSVAATSLTLNTTGGNDVISILNSTFGAPPFGVGEFISLINAGGTAGNDRDTVTITNTDFFGGLDLRTGVDADYVTITLSTFYGPTAVLPHTSINLGDGNDVLIFNSNQIDDVALIQLIGGLGTDIGYAFFNTDLFGNRAIFPQGGGFELLVSI